MHVRKIEKNVLNCHVDADFAGLYGKEDPQDPTSCRSRTGFIISIDNNPVAWSSKLQTQTADSTMCAEYLAASKAMHSPVPLRRIHQEISQCLNIPFDKKSDVTVIFEDNLD